MSEHDFLVPANDRVEKRRAVRLACDVVRTRDWKPIGKQMVDLSTSGLQLVAEDHAQLGEEVQVLFRLPFTNLWSFVEGTVKRVVRGWRPGDYGPSYGIEMAKMDPILETILRGTLWRFPPTIPWRPKRIDYAASVRLIGCS